MAREEGASALWKGLAPGAVVLCMVNLRLSCHSVGAYHPLCLTACFLPCVSFPAGLQRQVVYGGLRIGLYEPIRNAMVGKDHTGDVSLGIKIAAGLTTGAIGISVASPTDLVKVSRQQADVLR